MVLWKADEAASATQGEAQGVWNARRVVIDSRSVQEGDLFVALKGERFDGHEFVAAALQQGAAAVMVEAGYEAAGSVPALRVGDTFVALQALARKARQRTRARIAGITGSVGKTSTKEALALILSAQGRVHMTQGNYNNHIGVPLTLANMPQECDFAVIEMGMNHAAEITPLSRLTRPHAALITAVEAVHMEFFANLDGIAAAKCEICAGLEPEAPLLLPATSPHLGLMQRLARDRYHISNILTFGAAEYADYRLINCTMEGLGMSVEAHIGNTPMEYRIGAYGEHWAAMSVGVLGLVEALHADVRAAAEALQRFHEPEGRGNIQKITLPKGDAYLIDDSYNASPASMRAAFAKLAGVHRGLAPEGRMVAVLGDMLELGEASPQFHAELAKELEITGVHQLFVAGTLMRHLWNALPPGMRGGYASTAAELLPLLRTSLQEGDTVLLKGSHGSHIHTLAGALKDALHENEE